MIADGDGQHRPEDVARIVASLGEYDLVVGARAPGAQASTGRRLGNAILNRLASYLTERDIPDLTSGLRGARREHLLEFLHMLPNGFSTPTTTTLAFMRAGYNVLFEPVDVRPRTGTSKIRLARDGFPHARVDGVDQPRKELEEELVLRVEVIERDSLRDPRPARDVVQRHVREAFFGDLAECGLEQKQPAFGLAGVFGPRHGRKY